MNIVTCVAPVNIAVIKYWGKRDEGIILPYNDSISASLDTSQLCAKTTVMASPDFQSDRIWLNGREESINNPRLQRCLRAIREKAGISLELANWKVHICSSNNFPTAAGLASSAAGYACLTASLAKLYNYNDDISSIARLGSGSACRSVFGGFVRWHMGSDPNGTDSISKQIAPASHWPELRILILVVNDSKKKISSEAGMRRTVQTSELYKYRTTHCVPKRAEDMQRAIMNKDFTEFATLTMKDSNQMHAVCLDSYPAFTYLNDTSHAIIRLIHAYNDANGLRVAYTNDAGPNTVLYLEETTVPELLGVLEYFFPARSDQESSYLRGDPPQALVPTKILLEKINIERQLPGQLNYIIHTRVGDGPTYLEDPKQHLLDKEGLPVDL